MLGQYLKRRALKGGISNSISVGEARSIRKWRKCLRKSALYLICGNPREKEFRPIGIYLLKIIKKPGIAPLKTQKFYGLTGHSKAEVLILLNQSGLVRAFASLFSKIFSGVNAPASLSDN